CRRAPPGHLASNGVGRLSTGQCALHHEAPLRVPRVSDQVDASSKQTRDNGPCSRLRNRLVDVAGWGPHITIGCPGEECFPVAEGRIKARSVDTHGLRQIGERRPFIAFPPEDLQCAVERIVDIESPGTSSRHRKLLLYSMVHYVA